MVGKTSILYRCVYTLCTSPPLFLAFAIGNDTKHFFFLFNVWNHSLYEHSSATYKTILYYWMEL